MAEKKALYPFRLNTRQRIQYIGSMSYTDSGQTRLEIPQVGFLSGLLIRLTGTVTLSAAGALADLGPWSIIRRLVVGLNLGQLNVVDVTGYGAYLANLLRTFGSNIDSASQIYSAPVAAGANTWELNLYVPIGANNGENFDFGLINLQAPEVQAYCQITWGTPADFSTLVTSVSMTAHVSYLYYEVPDPREVKWPANVVHRILEDQQPITQTGENAYTVLRQGVIGRLTHYVRLNGARSASVDELRLRINKTDTIYSVRREHQYLLQNTRYGRSLPTGVFVWDFWNANESVARGDFRDTIDSEAVTTLESVPVITTGATMGTNNNFLNTVREIFQALQ